MRRLSPTRNVLRESGGGWCFRIPTVRIFSQKNGMGDLSGKGNWRDFTVYASNLKFPICTCPIDLQKKRTGPNGARRWFRCVTTADSVTHAATYTNMNSGKKICSLAVSCKQTVATAELPHMSYIRALHLLIGKSFYAKFSKISSPTKTSQIWLIRRLWRHQENIWQTKMNMHAQSAPVINGLLIYCG